MIGALKGTILTANKNPIILFVHDVGYTVHITEAQRSTLKPNGELLLYIHSHIREDAFDLFGFSTEKELVFFELLLTVSGIGPKTALTIIDRGVKHIEKAIMSSDVDFFTTVPRLGKKNAQKIIIELSSKLGSLEELDLTFDTPHTKELIDALTSMGFAKKDVIDVVKHLPSDLSLEGKIKEGIKLLGKSL